MQLHNVDMWLYITVFAMAALDADLNDCLCQAYSGSFECLPLSPSCTLKSGPAVT